MVCSTACEVGCAIAACPDDSPKVPYIPDPSYSDAKDSSTFLVVCRYGPGFDSEEPIYKLRPYWKGRPCSKCPKGFDNCDVPGYYAPAPSMDSSVVGGEQIPPPVGGLCC